MSHATALIFGNLGRDPEQRYLPSGTGAVTLAVATSRKRGQDTEITTWWRATVWGKSGEVLAQHLHKGDLILLEGEPYLESWQGREGDTRQTLCLNVSRWSFVGKAAPKQDYQAPAQASAKKPFNDDIPF